VLVDMPKDILNARQYYPSGNISLRGYNPDIGENDDQTAEIAEAIARAKRPVIYAGGGVILGKAENELRAFARKTGIPVTTTLMGLGAFPESDPQSLGMLGMHGTWYANMAVSECDLLIAVGARFDDRVTGRPDSFAAKAFKIHIDIDPATINKNVPVDIPVVGPVKDILRRLDNVAARPDTTAWAEKIARWKREHPLHYDCGGEKIKPQNIIEKISAVTGGNAVIVTDVGQHQMWTAQYYTFNNTRSMITSGGLGTMGFGLPAAIGAAVGCPDRTVFCIAGDGSFKMTCSELATAVKYKLPVKVAIINNGYLGMVRQWQELFFGGRYSHSSLEGFTPDFVRLAECYGAAAMRAERPEEVEPALEEAMRISDRPVVMDFRVAPEENVYPMVPADAALHEMVEGPPK